MNWLPASRQTRVHYDTTFQAITSTSLGGYSRPSIYMHAILIVLVRMTLNISKFISPFKKLPVTHKVASAFLVVLACCNPSHTLLSLRLRLLPQLYINQSLTTTPLGDLSPSLLTLVHNVEPFIDIRNYFTIS